MHIVISGVYPPCELCKQIMFLYKLNCIDNLIKSYVVVNLAKTFHGNYLVLFNKIGQQSQQYKVNANNINIK